MKRTAIKRKTPLRRTKPMRWKGRDSATKRADALWARLVHARLHCAVCITYSIDPRFIGPLEAHHARGRGKRFRWRTEYALLLCAHHHRHSPTLSAHGAPASFKAWLERHHPLILTGTPAVETAAQAITRLTAEAQKTW